MICLISAVSKDLGIGKDNELLWHLPNELKFFKETTINHSVVMGYNTYLSIGKILPNRKNIVLTSREVNEGYFKTTIDEIKNNYTDSEEEIFIIGGARTYEAFIDVANKIYLTEIDAVKEADTYFPTFDKTLYKREILKSNNENGVSYDHVLYTRING